MNETKMSHCQAKREMDKKTKLIQIVTDMKDTWATQTPLNAANVMINVNNLTSCLEKIR